MRDVASARYSKIELAAFVVATNQFELDRDEVLHLTEAMIAEAGQRIDWQHDVGVGPVVDKHCIGGIPGNRTSMLVVPIVTAHGMLCPKTSSRAITSPAGTADTMEVLADVELPLERLQQIVRETRGCLAWGGTADLSPADDILISVERPLAHRLARADGGLDPEQETRRRLHPPGAGHPGRAERQGAQHARGPTPEEALRIRGAAPGPAARCRHHRRPAAHRPRHRAGAGGAAT
jgi:hypothetical protein